MNLLLIISKKDLASLNFYKQIKKNYILKKKNKEKEKYILNFKNKKSEKENNIYLKVINKKSVFAKRKDLLIKNKKIDLIIFLSKHQTTTSNKPKLITAHAIGNFSKHPKFGGKAKTLIKTDPILIRLILYKINKVKNKKKIFEKYIVKQEATHHGPYINLPCIFYEIGSSKEDWQNHKLANFLIKELIKILKTYNKEKVKTKRNWIEVAGLGGSHYCNKFNKYTLNKKNKYCFGHIIPVYALSDFKENLKDFRKQIKEKSNSLKIIKENLKEY